MDIKQIRKEIDETDEKLIELFNRRMELCEKIAFYKKENKMDIQDSIREEEVLSRASILSSCRFKAYTLSLYSEILKLSRQYQEKKLNRKSFFLIGEYTQNSLSPYIHSLLNNFNYETLSLKEDELDNFFSKKLFDGLNVTIPYKKTVIKYLDNLSKEAEEIGSVNTVIKKSDNSLWGYNTDYYGFEYLINHSKTEVKGKKVLILGSGGASMSVKAVLNKMNAKQIITISRKGDNNYESVSKHRDAQVIVNTTPVGMHPDFDSSALDISDFNNLEAVIDIIYNPLKTKLLRDTEERGIKAVGGLYMLVVQAIFADALFFDREPQLEKAEEIYSKLKERLAQR